MGINYSLWIFLRLLIMKNNHLVPQNGLGSLGTEKRLKL
jgi:hypothetical protein